MGGAQRTARRKPAFRVKSVSSESYSSGKLVSNNI